MAAGFPLVDSSGQSCVVCSYTWALRGPVRDLSMIKQTKYVQCGFVWILGKKPESAILFFHHFPSTWPFGGYCDVVSKPFQPRKTTLLTHLLDNKHGLRIGVDTQQDVETFWERFLSMFEVDSAADSADGCNNSLAIPIESHGGTWLHLIHLKSDASAGHVPFLKVGSDEKNGTMVMPKHIQYQVNFVGISIVVSCVNILRLFNAFTLMCM